MVNRINIFQPDAPMSYDDRIKILKERKREKKLHLTPSELKKADEILSSGKYLPKDHIIYNLALMEIKKELVIDFILSKFKTFRSSFS